MNENKSFIKNKSTIILSLIILVLIAVIVVPKIKSPKKSVIETISNSVSDDKKLTITSVEERLEFASELATLNYLYTSADIYEDSKKIKGFKIPFTTNMLVFKYDGSIKAGFDIKDVDIDIDEDRKEIEITLPEPKILSHEFDYDSFDVRDAKKSILNDLSFDDYNGFMEEQKKAVEEKFMSDEKNLEAVTENAKKVYEKFIGEMDSTGEYKIEFR